MIESESSDHPVHYSSGAKVFMHIECLISAIQKLEYSVLQNKMDALSDVKNKWRKTGMYMWTQI